MYCYYNMCEYLKVSVDEGIREGTTLEKLAKLKPAFQADGSTTAGRCFILNFEFSSSFYNVHL